MDHPSPITIRVCGVPEPFNLPWRLGVESGAFLREGIELQWQDVHQGTGAMCQQLAADTTDLAVLVTEGAVRDVLLGSGNNIVTTLVNSSLHWGVHVGAHTNLHSAKDLVGVPFAISRFFSGSHLMAMIYAERLGWTPQEKDFIIVNDLDGAVALLKGPKPAIFLWERAMTAVHVESGALRNVEVIETPWPAFTLVARKGFLQEHSQAVDRALRVFRDQAEMFLGQGNAAMQVVKRYGLPAPDAQLWCDTVRWNLSKGFDLEALLAAAQALGHVGMLANGASEDQWSKMLNRPSTSV